MTNAQPYLFATLMAVFIIFIILLRYKKKQEERIEINLNALMEAGDWHGVCRILRRQQLLWSGALVPVTVLLVLDIDSGRQCFTAIPVLLLIIWRMTKLTRNYRIARKNMELSTPVHEEPYAGKQEDEEEEKIRKYLDSCRCHEGLDSMALPAGLTKHAFSHGQQCVPAEIYSKIFGREKRNH